MSTGSTPPPAPAVVHHYPGGENDPSYRWAFTLWLILFLGVVCLGLLNFLGIAAERWWPSV
jgi:hypothetical protein